MQIMIMI